jgi:hypothetical protein
MTTYDNNMRGVLFRNNDKRDGKKDADYRGNAEIDRKQFWVDAWINESRDGSKRLSLQFKPKTASEHKGAPANPPAQTAAKPDFDDDIPF